MLAVTITIRNQQNSLNDVDVEGEKRATRVSPRKASDDTDISISLTSLLNQNMWWG